MEQSQNSPVCARRNEDIALASLGIRRRHHRGRTRYRAVYRIHRCDRA